MSETPRAPRRVGPDPIRESRCASGDRYAPDLKAFADGELSIPRRFLVTRHVAGCAACRDEIEAMRKTTDELKRVADATEAALSPALRSRLLAAATEARASAPAVVPAPAADVPFWQRRRPVLVFASGAVALALFATVFLPLREQAGSVGQGVAPEVADFAPAPASASEADATTASAPAAKVPAPPTRPRPGSAAVPAPAVPRAAEPPRAAPNEVAKAAPLAAAAPPVLNERSASAPKSGDTSRALDVAVPREKDAFASGPVRAPVPAAATPGVHPSKRGDASLPAPARARDRFELKSDGAATAPSSTPATPPVGAKEETRPAAGRSAASSGPGAAPSGLGKGMGGVAGGFGAAPGGAPDVRPAPGLRGGSGTDVPTGPAAQARMGNLVTQNATAAQAAADEIVVTLAVEDVAASEARVRKIVAEADGTVVVVGGASAQSRAQQQESRDSLNLYHQSLSQPGITSRVPADRVEEAVVKLGQIGEILERRVATFALDTWTRARPQGGAQQEGVGGRGAGGSRADSAEYQRGAPAQTQSGEARRSTYGAQKSTLVVRLVAKPKAAKPPEPAKKSP